LIAYELLESKN